MGENRYFFLGGIVSISLYSLIIGTILFYFYHERVSPKTYSYHKKDILEITIVEKREKPKQEEPKKLPVQELQKEVEKKEEEKKPKDDSPSRDKVEKENLKSLFSTVKTDDYKKIAEEKLVSHKAKASRLKKQIKEKSSKKKKKILKLIKNLELSHNVTGRSSKKGEYNEYIGKIQEIIDLKWQETAQTLPGNKANVLIKIDKYGRFSYKIEKLSYNNAFNNKLKEFLENLKYNKFPPYKKGRYIEIKIQFKDE